MFRSIKKVIRFWKIYGLKRTIIKAAGRSRKLIFLVPIYLKKNPEIGLIGCGQFQFSTIAFFLSRGWTNRFSFAYDIDLDQARSLGRYYKIPLIPENKNQLDLQSNISLVYIASNHASHTPYAIQFLQKDIDVYCEKPISVSFSQLDQLISTINSSSAKFYAGYNRPYSGAIKDLRNEFNRLDLSADAAFSLNCFISAHDIPPDHWYRDPEEGSRICGNVGHWIDLMIHMYHWRGYIPKEYHVQIAYSNIDEPDDNITISITTPRGDLTSITITSRSEPFEGINETINFQYQSIIAKIDDFRRMTIWNDHKLKKKRYWPKDVGHKRSVMQPFRSDNRDLNEVIASTELMLHILEMVKRQRGSELITLSRI